MIGATVPLAAVGYAVKKPYAWSLAYTVLRFATIAQASGANRDQEAGLAGTVVGSIVAGAPKGLEHPLNSGEWMMGNGAPSNVHCWITVGVSYRNLDFVVSASGPGAPLVYHAPSLQGMPQVLVSHPTCNAVEGVALGTARHLYETAVRYANAHGVH